MIGPVWGSSVFRLTGGGFAERPLKLPEAQAVSTRCRSMSALEFSSLAVTGCAPPRSVPSQPERPPKLHCGRLAFVVVLASSPKQGRRQQSDFRRSASFRVLGVSGDGVVTCCGVLTVARAPKGPDHVIRPARCLARVSVCASENSGLLSVMLSQSALRSLGYTSAWATN